MKIKYYLTCFVLLTALLPVNAQVTGSKNSEKKGGAGYKVNWKITPFDHQVFIENKGQFTADVKNGDKILYGTQIGDIYAFITNHGIIYKYTEYPGGHLSADKKHWLPADPDDIDPSAKPIQHYLTATWEGASNDISTIASEEQTGYFIYPYADSRKGGIKVNDFKKVTCLNVYPGIDVEFVFPKDTEGIKYTLIVHPGANLSLVKLKYSGAENMLIDPDGNVNIKTGWGTFIDHAPVSYYEEDNSHTGSGYKLKNNEETFTVNNLDAAKTLMVDPVTNYFIINPTNFGNRRYTGAYDVDYDYAGNVYVYGGYSSFEVQKYTSAGVLVYTYPTANFTEPYYGSFCVDKTSGDCYAFMGFDPPQLTNPSINIDELSPSGALLNTYTLSNTGMDEIWKASYDLCDHVILMAGGGNPSNTQAQAATIDSGLTSASFTLANVMGLPNQTGFHDMALVATDPILDIGYMASTSSTDIATSTLCNNNILQMPLPTLLPVTYDVADNFTFQEVMSIPYVGPGIGYTNGYNGMAVSPNWLYMYDGATLRQLNKNTAALNASAAVSGTQYSWGGLSVDLCDDIYVGNATNVDLYNSTLALTGTIGPFPADIYDVVLGSGGLLPSADSTLYVCGDGFLSSVKLTNPNPAVILKTRTLVCSCNCTATGTLSFCGTPVTTNVTYLWSNGMTTQTATGLCPGNTYTLTATVGCETVVNDTFDIPFDVSYTVTKAQTNFTCIGPGSASVNITGGTNPYTYSWSTGATTSSITGLTAGNYCVTVFDFSGCQDSACFIINGTLLPTISVTPTPDTVCPGSGVALTATGGVSYVWTPATGLSCTACANPTASPGSTTTYTVTGTDVNGCSNTDTAIVVVNPLPVITITPAGDTVCIGDSVTLTASGAATYTWTPSTGLSCTTCALTIANPSSTTIYTVKGTDAQGCTATAAATVSIAEPPTITVSASKTSICEGTTVSLQASATNITSPYTWQPGSMSGPNISVTPTITTTYTVSASSGCGTATATVTISVNDVPTTAFSADVTSGCSPLCVQFRDRSTTGTGAITQWGWSFGNGDSLNTKNPIYCYSSSGIYSVSLTTTTDSGCSGSLTISNMISVYSDPIANFTAAPQPTTILEPAIQFTNATTDAYGIIYWIWNFGEPGDTLSNLENPLHTYQDTGTFCPTLVAINQHGCVDTVTNCLVINPIFTCYIPDGFSPNGDGVNDVFEVKGHDIKSFEMYIFDRWGLQLFHTTDINNGWKGEVNNAGAICQQDAYVYLITVYDNKDQKHTFMGTVNLLK